MRSSLLLLHAVYVANCPLFVNESVCRAVVVWPAKCSFCAREEVGLRVMCDSDEDGLDPDSTKLVK
jgi:hypothetical protein